MKKRTDTHVSIIILTLLAFIYMPGLNTYASNIYGDTMKPEKANTLLELDKTLSQSASKEGILRAFFPYLTQNSVLLPLRGRPAIGGNTCKAAMEKIAPQKLAWEPLLARVSSTGDLGYTHGRFKKDKSYGYYFTVWQKQRGQWKLAVSQGLIDLKDFQVPPVPPKEYLNPNRVGAAAKAVWENELAFSRYSVEHGSVKAFYKFMADDGMALSMSGPPNKKEVYKKALNKPKGNNTLEWKPIYTFMSSSAGMACNYGPYTYTSTTQEGKKRYSYGYFVTVWKKQANGQWRFLIDGGNTSPAYK